MRSWERSLRTLLMWAAYVVMVLFYLIPVAAVQVGKHTDRRSPDRQIKGHWI